MMQDLLVILTLLIVSFLALRKLVMTLKGKGDTCACEKGNCKSCSHCAKTFQIEIEDKDK